jgi:hypothetical protein
LTVFFWEQDLISSQPDSYPTTATSNDRSGEAAAQHQIYRRAAA